MKLSLQGTKLKTFQFLSSLIRILLFPPSRVSQYVYVPTKDSFFGTLDSHADTLEGDVKPPLVLLGNEGLFNCLLAVDL